jgi:hypothetical protein
MDLCGLSHSLFTLIGIEHKEELMGKILLTVVVFLLAGILGFNLFFGTREEKDSSRKIIGQVHELSVNVVTLLNSEKEKFDEGKYHDALANVKEVLGLEHERAESLGENGHDCLDRCSHLEEQEHELEAKLMAITRLPEDERDAAVVALRDEILKLTSDAEDLAKQLDG